MSRRAVVWVLLAFVSAGCAAKVGGQPAPDLALADIDGHPFRLSGWFGEPILLEVFGVQCGSCEAMMSQLVPFHDEYGERVRMVSIDLGANFDGLGADDVEEVREWRERHHANWTFALDAEDQRTNEAYPHSARPTIYLIDRDAHVDRVLEGWTVQSELELHAKRLLGETST